MKVLVPLDGSRLADGILTHVRRLARQEGEPVDVVLLAVHDLWPSQAEQEDRRKELEAHLGALARLLGGEGIGAKVVVLGAVDAAEQILEHARAHAVDLVAMSTHGRSGLQRWVRGSVAERVLREAATPLYLANPQGLHVADDQTIRWGRILVPLDGSERAGRVLPLAGMFATASGSEVVLLHVDRPGVPGVHPVPEIARRNAQGRAESELAACRDQLAQAGVEAVRVVGRYGEDPAAEVLEAATELKADLIAISSHGRTGLRRWRFGSVAEKVLRAAPCPLLVVRAEA